MNARWFLISAATIAVLAAGLYHQQATRVQSERETEAQRVRAEIAETRRLSDETARQLATARSELQTLLAAPMDRPPPSTAPVARPPAAKAPAVASPEPAFILSGPELRRIQVQAFVSDQRLRFAALLKRLGFGAEKLRAFDRIQSEHVQATLDGDQSAGAKQQATQARDARLKELFGPAHDQWIDANRAQPARAVVEQIVQQTFQSSGAVTTAQADELTRIVGAHRSQEGRSPSRYDWDAIIAEAGSILAERQTESFAAAIQLRRATEKMTAMAADKKPE